MRLREEEDLAGRGRIYVIMRGIQTPSLRQQAQVFVRDTLRCEWWRRGEALEAFAAHGSAMEIVANPGSCDLRQGFAELASTVNNLSSALFSALQPRLASSLMHSWYVDERRD